MLVCATLFWAGNFTLAKLAYLENIPPNSLAFLRWCLVWIILLPFTYKEILKLKNQIKENLSLFLILDFDNGLLRPPNSTVPTTLNPCSIGVMPKPLLEKITGLLKR